MIAFLCPVPLSIHMRHTKQNCHVWELCPCKYATECFWHSRLTPFIIQINHGSHTSVISDILDYSVIFSARRKKSQTRFVKFYVECNIEKIILVLKMPAPTSPTPAPLHHSTEALKNEFFRRMGTLSMLLCRRHIISHCFG